MPLTIRHQKTNAVPDWTQPQLNEIIAGGAAPLPPAGTTLSQITLPSDWNADHTLTGTLDPDQIPNRVNLATASSLPSYTYSNGTSGVGATITKSAPFSALTVDGTTVSVGDTILVQNGNSTAHNGIYTVTNAGSGAAAWVLTRATWFDTSAKIMPGLSVYVLGGSTNLRRTFSTPKTTSFTVGTTAMTWSSQRVSLTQDVTGTLNLANGGTASNTSSYASGAGFFYHNGTQFATSSNFVTDGTKVSFGAGYTWVDQERLRVQGTSSTPNTPSSPSTVYSGGQTTNGYTASGAYHDYRVYGYKDIGGTTYFSVTPATTSYTDTSQTITIDPPSSLTAAQNFGYSGYTDQGFTNNYSVVAYKTYPGGFSVSSIGTGTASYTEGTTFSSYGVDLSWSTVSGADGYFLISDYNGTIRYQDVGNVSSFVDTNNSWTTGALPYSTPTSAPDTYYVIINWSIDPSVDGYIVTVQDSTGRVYDVYQTLAGSSNNSLTDDNTNWQVSPVLTPNYYYGDALVVEGASYFTGSQTITGNTTQTGNIDLTGGQTVSGTATFNGDVYANASLYSNAIYGSFYGTYYGSTIPINYGGTNTTSFTSARGIFFNGSALASTAQNTYVNSGSNITHNLFTASAATNKPLVLRGAASQSGNLQEWQNSSGNIGSYMGASGADLVIGNGSTVNGTLTVKNSSDDLLIVDNTGDGRLRLNATGAHTQYIEFTPRDSGAGGVPTIKSGSAFAFSPSGGAASMAFGESSGSVYFQDLLGTNGLIIVPRIFYYPALTIRGAASQTANLQEWQNSSGTVLASIDKTGSAKVAGLSTALTTKTSNYTVTGDDFTILADATAAAITITLPTAVGIAGRIYSVKRISSGAHSVTVDTTSSQNIDGSTTYVLSGSLASVLLQSDGAQWWIISTK